MGEIKMNRIWCVISIFLLTGLTSWAQGTKAPFDMAKAQKELEIMESIFKTTLSFNSEDSQRDPFINFADIRFMYLQDQGAHFFMQILYFVPPVEIPMPFDESFQSSLKMMEENLERVQGRLKQKDMAVGEYYSARKSIEEKSAGKEQAKEALQAPKEQLLERQKEMEQQLQAQREQLLERQKEIERQAQAQKAIFDKQQADRRKKLPEIKESLIEAIANYGDSLTTVKSDEYINLVFDTSGQYDIVSIQKSWIKDYKAGNLTLDQLKAKAIQYTMKGR